jgi:hypothetical protein
VTDTGAADPRLATALGSWRDRPSPAAQDEVRAALAGARVFAAIAARSTAEHVDPGTGLRAESTAEMALLTLTGSAGGRAVPAFLDVASVVAFHEGARPVPLQGPELCGAALDDGAAAVLLDPTGASHVVAGAALVELAAGRVPIAGTSLSSQRARVELDSPVDVPAELVAAAAQALTPEPVASARLLAGPAGLVLGVVPLQPLDAAGLTALAARVLPRLAGVLPPEGLDLGVVAAGGPGVVLPLPPRRSPRRRSWRRLLRRGR